MGECSGSVCWDPSLGRSTNGDGIPEELWILGSSVWEGTVVNAEDGNIILPIVLSKWILTWPFNVTIAMLNL